MTTLNEAFQEFLYAVRADSLSPATIKQYKSIVSNYLQMVGDYSVDEIERRDMRSYIVEELQGRATRYVDAPQRPQTDGGLSRASVATHVTVLHRFWSWVASEYQIDNPMKGIRRPRRASPEPKAIEAQDFIRLFHAVSDTDAGIRDRALLCLLADTGARLGGVISLTVPDVSNQKQSARVIEKGLKSRLIFWTYYTQRMLDRWLAVRKSSNDSLWVSMNDGNPLTASGIYQLLKRLKKKAHVRGRVNPHSFRHAFARTYLENGGDLVTLARLMGHNDVNVTANYYAVFSKTELAELHGKHSPLLKLVEDL